MNKIDLANPHDENETMETPKESSNGNKMERYVNYDRHNKVWKVKVPKAGNTKLKVHKNFSVKKFGPDESYKLAVEHRNNILESQKNSHLDEAFNHSHENENKNENAGSEISSKNSEKYKGDFTGNQVFSRPKRLVSSPEDKLVSDLNKQIQDSGSAIDTSSRRHPSRSWKNYSDGSVYDTSPISTTPSLSHTPNVSKNLESTPVIQHHSVEKEPQNSYATSNNLKRKRGRPSKSQYNGKPRSILDSKSKIYSRDYSAESIYNQQASGCSSLIELGKESQRSYLCESEPYSSSENVYIGSNKNEQSSDERLFSKFTTHYEDNENPNSPPSSLHPRRSKRRKSEFNLEQRNTADTTNFSKSNYYQNEEVSSYQNSNSGYSILSELNSSEILNSSNQFPNYTSSTNTTNFESAKVKSFFLTQSIDLDTAMLLEAFFFVFADLLFVCVPDLNCTDRSRRRYDSTIKSILSSILDTIWKPGNTLENLFENCNWVELIIPYISELSLPSQTLPNTQCSILNSLCGLDKN